MKKLLLFIPFSIFNFQFSIAQPGEWTWIHGPNTQNFPATWGTQGVPSATNQPPSLYQPHEWTDLNGNFWMFAGWSNGAQFEDMWMYNPTTNIWTWIKGSGISNSAAVYGTKGVPAPTNSPGYRIRGGNTWTDLNGDLWYFGSLNSLGCGNDLWKYNIATNMWTWMSGDNFGNSPGNYGTQGIPSVNNAPPERYEMNTAWVDNSGNLWLFGGESNNNGDDYNDLWKYDIATNEWTWMKGNNFTGAPPVYGTLGVSAATNDPGGRESYTHWKDQQGNLWLFAGSNFISNSRNDMWKYDMGTNNWTWMSGTNVTSDPGSYGATCTQLATNVPSCHFENKTCWTDDCGNFWMIAGFYNNTADVVSDLWKYDPVTNNWILVSGSAALNDPGTFGTIGISNPANMPPSRAGGGTWMDLTGNMWLGYGLGAGGGATYSDMWRYVPDASCGGCTGPPVINFVASDRFICPNSCISFTNFTTNATSYQWLFPGASPATSTDVNPAFVCYDSTGNFSVTLIAYNSLGSDTITLNNLIHVYPQPVTPTIIQSGDTLFANTGYASYQWYYGSDTISGATNYFYVATQSGNYNLAVTDDNGCLVGGGILNVIAGTKELGDLSSEFSVFPNPSKGNFEISFTSAKKSFATIEMIDGIGKIIFRKEIVTAKGENKIEVNDTNFCAGIYLLKISDKEKIKTQKIVIER